MVIPANAAPASGEYNLTVCRQPHGHSGQQSLPKVFILEQIRLKWAGFVMFCPGRLQSVVH